MTRSAVRILILALAASALIAAPAVAQGVAPADPGVALAQAAAEDAAELAEEAASNLDGSADNDPSSDPCDDPSTSDEVEAALPVAADDDACSDDASDPAAGAGESSETGRSAVARDAKPLSLSIPLLLKRGYATIGATRASAARVIVQELIVAEGKAKRIARVRRVVKRSGRVTLRVAVSKPGRKVLRGARRTLRATVRTTTTLRSGRTTTSRRAVLLVPGRRG